MNQDILCRLNVLLLSGKLTETCYTALKAKGRLARQNCKFGKAQGRYGHGILIKTKTRMTLTECVCLPAPGRLTLTPQLTRHVRVPCSAQLTTLNTTLTTLLLSAVLSVSGRHTPRTL